ncbi:hypothetical protein FRB95_000358 [Tulasnella sp. JGI-2019a]|nr:hypothetical protein FRB95_000358 [Tulasnella sp. JGI-2019a]
MRRFDLARADSEAALSIPNHPWKLEVMGKLARCHIALGDPTAALQQTQEALKLNPLDNSILAAASIAERVRIDFQLSRDAWARKDWLEAKNTLARVIAECIGVYSLEWRICEVEVEIATRNWEAAISKAETTTELHPSSPNAFATLGLALILSNKLALCTAALQSAVRLTLITLGPVAPCTVHMKSRGRKQQVTRHFNREGMTKLFVSTQRHSPSSVVMKRMVEEAISEQSYWRIVLLLFKR